MKKTNNNKPQRGVTYKCIKSFTDKWGDRARKGQYLVLEGEYRGWPEGDICVVKALSGRGQNKAVLSKKFNEHFVALNPVK